MRGGVLVAVLALVSVGCKVKVDAKPVGFKEGSADTVVVHVVTEKGADITCSDDACLLTTMSSTEGDLHVKIPSTQGPKRVTLRAKKGPRKGEAVIDFEKDLPPNLVVLGNYGSISCEPRKCNGFFKLVPTVRVAMTGEPGTTFEVGTDKFTVPAGGYVEAPVTLPAVERLPLAKICVGFVSGQEPPRPFTTVAVTSTFPDKVKATTKAALDLAFVERDLSGSLDEVTKGPVLFPWEKAGARAAGKRAAIYVDGSHCYDAGATDAVLADLDVVAVSEGQERVADCTYTSSTSTLTGKTTMHDENATAYDRITGKKLGTKLFLAPKECLSDFRAKAGDRAPDGVSFVNKELIAKWAATFAR